MSNTTVLVQVIDQRGNRVPTVIPLHRLIDANETLDGDLWITYNGDKQVRKCRVNMSAEDFSNQCNGVATSKGAAIKQDVDTQCNLNDEIPF